MANKLKSKLILNWAAVFAIHKKSKLINQTRT